MVNKCSKALRRRRAHPVERVFFYLVVAGGIAWPLLEVLKLGYRRVVVLELLRTP
jgi:hypothetical protein